MERLGRIVTLIRSKSRVNRACGTWTRRIEHTGSFKFLDEGHEGVEEANYQVARIMFALLEYCQGKKFF